MNPSEVDERWDKADRLFESALDLPVAERRTFVERTCAEDTALRDRVFALLVAEERSRRFLGRSAVDVLAEPVERETCGEGSRPDEGDSAIPPRIGRYRVIREIGRGGWGTVYRAERDAGDFEQTVAIKLLRRGLDTDDVLARFRAERQILANLGHPNIARLLDGGAAADGRPYLVMELVDGLPITDYCRTRALPLADRLRLFITAARAVQYAHRRGVIHRDLKPSNILVTAEGEPKLLDFGIAKLIDEAEGAGTPRTRTGFRIMTPEFASPEQVSGQPVTPASDVYQLGVLLYQLLVGRLPGSRDGGSPLVRGQRGPGDATLPPSAALGRWGNRVATDAGKANESAGVSGAPSAHTRELRRELRRGLDQVVLKALQDAPERRYHSVEALVEDIERFLTGRPVTARSASRFSLALKDPAAPRGIRVLGLIAAVLLAGIFVGSRGLTAVRAAPELPLLAIGEFGTAGTTETQDLPYLIRNLLVAELSHAGASLLSSSRLHEVLAQLETGGSPVPEADAARAAGADEMLRGTLRYHDGGRFTLHLERVDLHRDRVRSTFAIEGDDPRRLASLGVARLLADLGMALPKTRVASSLVSPTAHRFYEEGLRAYYRGDDESARRYLLAAVAEDSTFAMPSYYLSRLPNGQIERGEHINRALRHSGRSPEAERLFIGAAWSGYMFEPGYLRLADSMVRRSPGDPEARFRLGDALFLGGDYSRAIHHLKEVVELDSLAFRAARLRCRGCDAMSRQITAYILLDSIPEAERVARRWIELQPASALAWVSLSNVLLLSGRPEAAITARQRATEYRATNPEDAVYPAIAAIFSGDFERADGLLSEKVRFSPPAVQREAIWWTIISLRNQGRLREALAAARLHRDLTGPDYASWSARSPEAVVLFEGGRLREAIALYEQLAHETWNGEASPNRLAGHRAWVLTHLGNARAVAGDTIGLEALADSIEALGRRSGHHRFRVAHHHVRGMLARARGDRNRAVEEFHRAEYAVTEAYGRTKVELARTLLELDRPREALRVIQPVLRSGMTGPVYHAPRSEVHEILGHVWDALGHADSASVYYGRVLHAWRAADPELHDRRAGVQSRLRALEDGNRDVPSRNRVALQRPQRP
jgi:serine/threonine protein kinase/tetratricopeptide (TPR) repeat protein